MEKFIRGHYLQNKLLALIFIAPAFLIFGVILWYPIFLGFKMSFFEIDFVRGDRFVGLQNFKIVLNDPLLTKVVFNTLYYMFLALAIGYFIPIITAIVIAELRKIGGFVRSIVYLPAILPGIAIYALWYWMFEPTGLINTILDSFSMSPLPFLNDSHTALPSLVVMDTWLGFGGTTLIYLAALRSVSEELYEAAEIDGAGVFRRIWHVTLPGLRNVMLIILILQLIGTAQVFGGPFVMTKGGPANATSTVMYLVYQYAFVNFRFGPASALGTLFFIALVVLSGIFLWVDRKPNEKIKAGRRGERERRTVRKNNNLEV